MLVSTLILNNNSIKYLQANFGAFITICTIDVLTAQTINSVSFGVPMAFVTPFSTLVKRPFEDARLNLAVFACLVEVIMFETQIHWCRTVAWRLQRRDIEKQKSVITTNHKLSPYSVFENYVNNVKNDVKNANIDPLKLMSGKVYKCLRAVDRMADCWWWLQLLWSTIKARNRAQ